MDAPRSSFSVPRDDLPPYFTIAGLATFKHQIQRDRVVRLDDFSRAVSP